MSFSENPLLSRLSNEELLVAADRKEWFESSLRGLVGHEKSAAFMADMSALTANNDDGFWPAPDDWRAVYRPYIVKMGVLQLPVFGVLLNRFSYQVGRYATGYTYILRALQRGMEDPEVKGIAFICETPGGEVAGNFELVDQIYGYRGTKPMAAFAAEYAYSAGYSIASAVDPGKLFITRTGGVGSVGVVTAHVDYSEALKQSGVKVTFIFAGKHKVDGNAYEKLPDSVKARIKARIDRLYGIFTATVARNRGMDEQAVRDTEALTFSADEALDVGFADSVGVFEETIEAYARSLEVEDDEASAETGEDDMATYTQEQHDKAIADARADENAKATAAATTAASAAATARINAIIGSEEGKARPKAAMAAALKSDMSVDVAKAFLADLPEEKAAAPAPAAPEGEKKPAAAGGHFEAAMEKGNPNVGASGGNAPEGEQETGENPLVAAYGLASGRPVKKTA